MIKKLASMIKNTFNRATLIWSIIAVFLLTGGGVGTFFIVNANKSTTSFITDTVITTSTNDLNVVYGNTKTITYHASEKGQWHFTTDATNFLDYSIDENNDLTVVLSASANVGQYPYTVSFSPPPEKYAFNPETIDAVITVLTSDAIKIVQGSNVVNEQIFGAETKNTYTIEKDQQQLTGGTWSLSPKFTNIDCDPQNGTITYGTNLAVGVYNFAIQCVYNPNYVIAELPIEFAVNLATPVIGIEGDNFTISKVYGASTSKKFNSSVPSGKWTIIANPHADITLNEDNGDLTAKATLPVGEYPFTVNYLINEANPDYRDATIHCMVIVQSGTTTINTQGNDFTITKVYGGDVSKTFTGSVSGGTFSLTGNTNNDISITQGGVLTAKATLPVGEYTASIKYALNNYTDATATCTIVVQPGTTAINTANNDFTITKVYGAPAASRTFTGSVSGGTFSLTNNPHNDIAITQAGVLSVKATVPVGNYSANIKYTLANYTDATKTCTIVVQPGTTTINTANNDFTITKVYGAPAASRTFTGSVSGGTFSLTNNPHNDIAITQAGVLTAKATLPVGEYTASIKYTLANYTDATATCTIVVQPGTTTINTQGNNFTITKIYATADATKTFTGSVSGGTFTLTNNPHNDIAITQAGVLTAKATLPAGNYSANIKYTLANYTDATATCTIVVQPGTTAINTADNDFTITKVYGGDVSKTFTGSVSGGTFSLTGNTNNDISITQGGVLTAKATLPVGEYTASIKYALNNYIDATATCTIVVQPGTTTISAEDNNFTITKVYGAPDVTKTFTGSVSGGTFSLTGNTNNDITITQAGAQAGVLTVKATLPVGNYSANIKYTLANYTDATATCTIVVQPGAAPTINSADESFAISTIYGDGATKQFNASLTGGEWSLTDDSNNGISISLDGKLTVGSTLPIGEYTAHIKYTLNNYTDATATCTIVVRSPITITTVDGAFSTTVNYGDYANYSFIASLGGQELKNKGKWSIVDNPNEGSITIGVWTGALQGANYLPVGEYSFGVKYTWENYPDTIVGFKIIVKPNSTIINAPNNDFNITKAYNTIGTKTFTASVWSPFGVYVETSNADGRWSITNNPHTGITINQFNGQLTTAETLPVGEYIAKIKYTLPNHTDATAECKIVVESVTPIITNPTNGSTVYHHEWSSFTITLTANVPGGTWWATSGDLAGDLSLNTSNGQLTVDAQFADWRRTITVWYKIHDYNPNYNDVFVTFTIDISWSIFG